MSTLALVRTIVRQQVIPSDIRTEFFRKSIHILIALVPLIAAAIGTGPTLSLLAGGVLFYTYTEIERSRGKTIPFVTRVTRAAARDADNPGRIILGPITLGIGAMVSLLLYPEPASVIAIYALAFGDGISSIVGKAFGRVRIPRLQGKTLEGSAACFIVVFLVTLRIMDSVPAAGMVAMTAMTLEAIPVKDLDNILMPMGTGFVASLFLI